MIRLGTRASPLAVAQADRVVARLSPGEGVERFLIESAGDRDLTSPLDRPERAGAFTSALTDAILDGRIDVAVHSLKDLPLETPPEAPIAAILPRDDPADILLIREDAHDATRPLRLRAGSRVGTCAPRRQTQLLAADPDLVPIDVRGNIARRVALLGAGILDGLFIAAAALERLPPDLPPAVLTHRLPPHRFPPAPGQGTIAVQTRRASHAAALLAGLDDAETRAAVRAERKVLEGLGGGCGMPLGVHAWREPHGAWRMHATLAGADWREDESPVLRHAEIAGKDLDRVATEIFHRLQARDGAPPPQHPLAPRAGPGALRTVLATFDDETAGRYRTRLRSNGWHVAAWPLITTKPTGKPIPDMEEEPFWIAVSSARAAPFAARAAHRADGTWRRFRVAANGPGTAWALRRAGLPVHAVARDGTGAELAATISRFPADPAPILFVAARNPAGGFLSSARRFGLLARHWAVYEVRASEPAPMPPMQLPAHALLVTSPSNAQAIHDRGDAEGLAVRWLAIGATTAHAMERLGLPLHETLPEPTPAALARILDARNPTETTHTGHATAASHHD